MEQAVLTWNISAPFTPSSSAGVGGQDLAVRRQLNHVAYPSNSVSKNTRSRPIDGAAPDHCSVAMKSANDVVVDENEEWAKIENIMASLDCGMNDNGADISNGYRLPSNVGNKYSAHCSTNVTSSPNTSRSVRQWLESIGLSHLEELLVTNGFDDIDFIGPGIISDSDLIEIGVDDVTVRHKLLAAVARLPSIHRSAPKHFDSLAQWLGSLRLSEYAETFQLHGYTTISRLHNLWDVELTSVIHISRMGHRNRIMAAVGVLPQPPVPRDGSCYQFESGIELDTTVSKQSLTDVSLYKDYTTLLRQRSKTSHSLTSANNEQRHRRQPQQNDQQVDLLHIRPPQSESSEIRQWSHQPEVLLNGGCSYKVMYVGQGVVDSFGDTNTTHEAIAVIRQKCSKSLRGVATISLSISHTGVELIRVGSREVLGFYSIGNIFCVCQDVQQLEYFAFVTFQPATNQHLCHVFCADSVQSAVEVVLTLGQAFEIAYQLAVQHAGNTVTGDDSKQTNSLANGETCTTSNFRSPATSSNGGLMLKL